MVRRILFNLLIAIIFLVGLGFLLYPRISNLWNQFHQSYAVAGYESAIAELDQVDLDVLFEAAQEYNKKLINKEDRWIITKESRKEYESMLNYMENGVMGYVEIPSIEVALPIYHGTGEEYLQIGAGHMEGSSLPTGGKGTHCVIAGHRGLPSAELFTRLDEMKEGDLFYISCVGKTYIYRVFQVIETKPEDFAPLEIDEEKDLCTLITCTPYGINTERLLVQGERIGMETGKVEEEPEVIARNYRGNCIKIIAIFVFVAIFILLILILLQWQWVVHSYSAHKHNKKRRKRRRRKKRKHDKKDCN